MTKKSKAATVVQSMHRTRSLVDQATQAAHEQAKDRRAAGKAMREQVPPDVHASYDPPADRPDPVALLQSQDAVRIQSLVPIRFGRMAVSPFAFYRGAAIVMANDLARTPVTGWLAQTCGDAHIENFGGYGGSEGSLVFDVNDFDESYPAPWEWDLKRLATSAVLAGRAVGAKRSAQRDAARTAATGYRASMNRQADTGVMQRWTAVVGLPALLAALGETSRQIDKAMADALRNTNTGALAKLTTLVDGAREIKEKPPLVVRITDNRELHEVHEAFGSYRDSLRGELRLLLDRFTLVDFARKVVGVGSVGMPAYVGLLLSADGEPLFLQVKAAVDSVLQPFVDIDDPFPHNGERVVVGQRLMQAASDPLLGWTTGPAGGHYYVRQLRDMKLSFDVARMKPKQVTTYTQACARVLAHAHARTGDPALVAGYLGRSSTTNAFDDAVAEFAETYADQTERDHAALLAAIDEGRVEARDG